MLYQKLLERDFEQLPPVLRDFHATPGGGRASRQVVVRHANRLLARLLRFPSWLPRHSHPYPGGSERR